MKEFARSWCLQGAVSPARVALTALLVVLTGCSSNKGTPPVATLLLDAPVQVSAGVAFAATVTATDAAGAPVVGYRGTVHFSSVDAHATLPPDYAFTAADAGRHTFSGVVLQTAGGQRLVAADGALAASASRDVAVSAGPAAALVVSGLPATQVAGASTGLRVAAVDAFGNPATTAAGTLHLSASDAQATLPADHTLVAPDNGAFQFTGLTLVTAGAQQVNATLTGGPAPLSGAQASVTVTHGPPARLLVAGYPSSVMAYVAQSVRVSVLDVFQNPATDFTGTVTVTSDDAAAGLNVTHTFALAEQGSALIGGIALATPGAHSLTASLGGTAPVVSGSQGGITVQPDPAVALSVTGFPGTIAAGATGSVLVTAVDGQGKPAVSYTGTVRLALTNGGPKGTSATFTAQDQGRHTFTGLAFLLSGVASITATDQMHLTASQSGIQVTPGPVARLLLNSITPSSQTAGKPISFRVQLLDQYGNPETGSHDTLTLTSSDPAALLPATYTLTDADAGAPTLTATAYRSGSVSFTATLGALSATNTLSVVPLPQAPTLYAPGFYLTGTPAQATVEQPQSGVSYTWTVSGAAALSPLTGLGVAWNPTGSVQLSCQGTNSLGDAGPTTTVTVAPTAGPTGLVPAAGAPGDSGRLDGLGPEARIKGAASIALDGSGGLYASGSASPAHLVPIGGLLAVTNPADDSISVDRMGGLASLTQAGQTGLYARVAGSPATLELLTVAGNQWNATTVATLPSGATGPGPCQGLSAAGTSLYAVDFDGQRLLRYPVARDFSLGTPVPLALPGQPQIVLALSDHQFHTVLGDQLLLGDDSSGQLVLTNLATLPKRADASVTGLARLDANTLVAIDDGIEFLVLTSTGSSWSSFFWTDSDLALPTSIVPAGGKSFYVGDVRGFVGLATVGDKSLSWRLLAGAPPHGGQVEAPAGPAMAARLTAPQTFLIQDATHALVGDANGIWQLTSSAGLWSASLLPIGQTAVESLSAVDADHFFFISSRDTLSLASRTGGSWSAAPVYKIPSGTACNTPQWLLTLDQKTVLLGNCPSGGPAIVQQLVDGGSGAFAVSKTVLTMNSPSTQVNLLRGDATHIWVAPNDGNVFLLTGSGANLTSTSTPAFVLAATLAPGDASGFFGLERGALHRYSYRASPSPAWTTTDTAISPDWGFRIGATAGFNLPIAFAQLAPGQFLVADAEALVGWLKLQ